MRDIAPIDDIRSTARYRLRVAQNLLEEFLLAGAGQSRHERNDIAKRASPHAGRRAAPRLSTLLTDVSRQSPTSINVPPARRSTTLAIP